MKSVDDVFKVTKEDILAVKEQRIEENEFKKKHPILYKIKQHFATPKTSYINLLKEEINESWEKNLRQLQ